MKHFTKTADDTKFQFWTYLISIAVPNVSKLLQKMKELFLKLLKIDILSFPQPYLTLEAENIAYLYAR